MIVLNKKHKSKLSKYKFIDLFSGIGGFRLALESFGAKCVFSSEWDVHAQQMYGNYFGETPVGDITKIPEKSIPKHNILCAGFPCQAFSVSGKQKGFQDTRGTLFFDIVRIANYRKPEILFLENVKNFEKHDKGNTLNIVKSTLKKIGYDSYHKVINASHMGVPQKRERIYILCFHKKLKVKSFCFPKEQYAPVILKDYLLPDAKTKKYVINRDDIYLKKHVKVEIDLFGNYPLKPIRIGTVNKGGQGERIYHECGHAITLSAYGGGVGAKTGLYDINGKIRKLTPRECANIMGFPKNFPIDDSKSQAYKQFGNSVIPDILQQILLEIIEQRILP